MKKPLEWSQNTISHIKKRLIAHAQLEGEFCQSGKPEPMRSYLK
jgi:hypothetical protein